MENLEKQGKQEENEQNKNTIQYALDTTSKNKTKANKTWSLQQTTGVCVRTKNMNIRHIHLHFTPIQQGKGIEKCFSVSNT